MSIEEALQALADDYPAWWIDFLGEHSHVDGEEATRWLLERAELRAGDRLLDAGAFVGATARLAATAAGAQAVAMDMTADFLRAGRGLPGGELVAWVAGSTHRLPFRDGSFESVWCLDSHVATRELSRVAAKRATLCLCCEVPVDGRGGLDAFVQEWEEYGWRLAAHKQISLDALDVWRRVEAELVRKRPLYEGKYGNRGYLGQLDFIGSLVHSYERGEQGHGLFVFRREA